MTESRLALGITKQQVAAMQRSVNNLERANDAIGNGRVRREIDTRLVEIRLLLRDGHLDNLNGGKGRCPPPNVPWEGQ